MLGLAKKACGTNDVLPFLSSNAFFIQCVIFILVFWTVEAGMDANSFVEVFLSRIVAYGVYYGDFWEEIRAFLFRLLLGKFRTACRLTLSFRLKNLEL